jgi:HAD superfamily hydrolase (TIGR01548 family)
MESKTKKQFQALLNLLIELGAEILLSDGNTLVARFKDSKWVGEALSSFGIETEAAGGTGSPGADVRIAVPKGDASFEGLSRSLRTALNPEALLFDIDDTLADVTESYRAATVAVAASYGVEATFDDITAAKAAGDANNDWELTWRLVREGGIDTSLVQVTERFEEMYQGTPENPGMREREILLAPKDLIERLASKIALGIVTGRPLRDALAFLEAKGIRHLFQALVTMDDGPLKPDPGPCLLALERLGVQRAWMIGDTPDDMRSALNAGVLPIGVVAPADDPEVARPALMEAGAARVLERIAEIEELLQ